MRVYSTIVMLSRHQMICLMLLLVAMLSSCVSEQVETEVPVPPVVEEPDSMSLLLACAPANSTQALTRLSDEVVQLNEYALFDPKVYEIGPEGSGVDMSFETNIERGTLLLSYMKYDWIKMPEEKAKTRVDGWKGKVKTITILPNDTPVERSAPFMLGIYDDNKEFMPLDTAWVRQKPKAVADNP